MRLERPLCLLDTGAVIAHLRGFPVVCELLMGLARKGPLAVSAVTLVEVWQGAREREVERTRLFFSGVRIVALDGELGEEAGLLAGGLRAKGFTVSLADAVVAATARRLGVPVLTTNAKHFWCVDGLEVWDLRAMVADRSRE